MSQCVLQCVAALTTLCSKKASLRESYKKERASDIQTQSKWVGNLQGRAKQEEGEFGREEGGKNLGASEAWGVKVIRIVPAFVWIY